MSTNSNRRTSRGKSRRNTPARTPRKPKGFPLSIHKGSGYWCKKVRGHVHYFGRVADDPKGEAALEEWLRVKDDLLAGREPRAADPEALTVVDLVNAFLTQQEERRDAGEISPRTFQGLHATGATLVKVFGRGRAVADLAPDDFGKLKTKLAKTRKAVALRNEMQRCRSFFRFAYVNGLIDREVRYGSKFNKPPLKQTRRERREHRQQHGKRMFEAAEVRAILAAAGQPLRAMTLLAINAGLGQSDLASLPLSALDLEGAMLDFPRPKTEAPRVCPLWAETVEAIREWLPERPTAKNRADSDLLFLTRSRNPAYRGNRFVKTGKNGTPIDGIGQEFSKLLKRLGLKRPGVGFYALRHSFRTVADEVLDPVAAGLIMGHVDGSMADHYREAVGEDRLRRVTEHVRAWLFDGSDDAGKESSEICDPSDPSDPNLENKGKTRVAKSGSGSQTARAGRSGSQAGVAKSEPPTPENPLNYSSGSQGAHGSQNREPHDSRPRLRIVG